jgi:hypothetical protein
MPIVLKNLLKVSSLGILLLNGSKDLKKSSLIMPNSSISSQVSQPHIIPARVNNKISFIACNLPLSTRGLLDLQNI